MKVKSIFLVCFLFLFSIPTLNAQSNFPSGSVNGTTEMNERISGPIIPNVSIDITEPQTGS